MAGFTALTLGGVALVILAGVALFMWRASRRSRGQGDAPAGPGPAREGKVYDLAEAEALANQAEQEGDCELAAELLESVGLLRRATDLYRRSGNIQKAAELELESLQLTRMANDVPSPRAQPIDTAWEDAGMLSDPPLPMISMPPVSEATLPPPREASLRPVAARGPSTFPPHSLPAPPQISSRPPARKLSLPPRKSSRPPKPISNRPRARTPTVDELLAMLAHFSDPDLGNIEIYYRLGLAYLAAQDTAEARKAFLTVEEISPGYRDANAYLEQLLPPVGAHPVVTSGSGPANHNDAQRERMAATGRRRNER